MTIELTPEDALELRLLLEWPRWLLTHSRLTLDEERELRRGVEVLEGILSGMKK